jgi:predicted dehydrogenase
MARLHLDVLQSLRDVEVVAASSRGIETLERLAKDYGISQRFRNNDEMLEKVKLDAVVVTVSAANVRDVTLTCIEKRASALIETPRT